MPDPNQRPKAEAEVVSELAKRTTLVELHTTADGAQLLSIPDSDGSREVKDVREITDAYLEAPRRAIGTSSHKTTDSFLQHVKVFADDDSAIFASPNPADPTLQAIYDYHRGGTEKGPTGPRFCKHRARLDLQRSKEWIAWTQAGLRAFDQNAFAEFIEERIDDARDPGGDNAQKATALAPIYGAFASPQRLLELKAGISLRVNQQVTKEERLASGEGIVHFSEAHTDSGGAPLKIPGAFLIAIPVFEGGVHYLMAVRLRYRVAGPKISWHLKLHDEARVFEDAFLGVVQAVREGSELPVFIGTPE